MDNTFLIFTLCIVPSLIIMWYIYTKDKIEKEPIYLLLILFVGGIISAVIALLISISLKNFFPFLNYDYSKMTSFQIFIKSFFCIAFIEEFSKWSFIFIGTWKNKNFNYMFDSIVYSVFLSLGFAAFENILYGFSFSSYGLMPIFLRGIISVPCHAVFGVFMGYYLGMAKSTEDKNKSKYIFLSLFIPSLLHFTYNFLLIWQNKVYYVIFIILVIVIYILAFFKIKNSSLIKKEIKTH